MKLRNGQNCAACVYYSSTNEYSWIIAKVEKHQTNGKYLVRDEEPDDANHALYVVNPNRITPYPTEDVKFNIGDEVLALWLNVQTNEWSTMFYPARITSVKSDMIVDVVYAEGDDPVQIETARLARFPLNFDQPQQILDNNPNTSVTEDSALSTPPESPQDQPNNSAPPENAPRSGHHTRGGKGHHRVEKVDRGTKEVKSDDMKSDKSKSPSPPPANLTNAQKKIHETRKPVFIFNKPQQPEKQEIPALDDEKFNQLAGPRVEIPRMHAEKGTPLLDSLQDPMLFRQDAPHETGSGFMFVEVKNQPNQNPGIFQDKNSKPQCGRLGRIFGEWSSK